MQYRQSYKQIMLFTPYKSQERGQRRNSLSTRSKTEEKYGTKRTMSTIESSSHQSLPKLKLNKNLFPLQKSLLFLGWDSTKRKNILPVIEEKRTMTIQPKRNLRMFKKYTTDQEEDNSELEIRDFRTIEPRHSKPMARSITRQLEDPSEKLLIEDNIKVRLDAPISKTATLPKGEISSSEKIPIKYFDQLMEDKEKKRNRNRYQPKLKSIRVDPVSSSLLDIQSQEMSEQKTIFDEYRNKERIYNVSSGECKQKISQCLPKTKIQNRELPKIPQKSDITDFIDSYCSLEDGFEIPVDHPDFIVIWGKKDLYIGQSKVENGVRVRDGKGILLTEHSHFEGVFRGNQKESGYQLRNNGIYKGEFSQNKRCGKGEFTWFNGEYYNGEWEDNQKHGSGIWTSSLSGGNPDTYIGEWKHGKVDGYGVHTWKNRANKYEGEFVDYLKHGKGIQRFENGDKYEGEYRNGKAEGYGEYFWADGSYYKGNFYNGIREMEGIYCEPNGNKYQGEYKNDCKHGIGKIFYTDGSLFKGTFVANKKQGEGQLRTKKGEVIKGYWRNGKLIQMF